MSVQIPVQNKIASSLFITRILHNDWPLSEGTSYEVDGNTINFTPTLDAGVVKIYWGAPKERQWRSHIQPVSSLVFNKEETSVSIYTERPSNERCND
jgi:hypothetical protein